MTWRSFFLTSLLAGLTACATTPPAAEPSTPTGAVTLAGAAVYRERVALPPDARLSVRISDVSLMDAPSPVIAETETATGGKQVPLPFSLVYDSARIRKGGRYSVSAQITDGTGRLLWITDTHHDLPARGQTIELRLVQVSH